MFDFIAQVRGISQNPDVMGIAITKADERKNYFKQTIASLNEMKDFYVFSSYVRIDSTIEWAQDAGQPVGSFKRSSRAAQEYEALAMEIDKQAQKRNRSKK
jgi:chromosome partitioning protein